MTDEQTEGTAQQGKSREDWTDVGRRIEAQIKRDLGGWAGAVEDDSWEKVGRKAEAKVRGKAKDIITSERAKGESSVSRRMSQPLVICCMDTAMNAAKVPNHNHRKSR